MNRPRMTLRQPLSRGAAEVHRQGRMPLECSTCYRRFATACLGGPLHKLSYSLSLCTTFAAFLLVASDSIAEAGQPKSSFAQVLADAAIDLKGFAEIGSGDTSFTPEQYEVAEQILYWLDRFDQENRKRFLLSIQDVAEIEATDLTGELVSVRGRSLRFDPMSADHVDSPTQFHVLRINVDELAEEVTVLCRQVPSQWRAGQLSEPVALQGVILSACEGDAPKGLVVLTDRIAWYPSANVPAGWLELARLGYDVALLGEVRHGQPFVDERVSNEAHAFRAMLVAVSVADYPKLLENARNEVTARKTAWQEESKRSDAQWKQAAKTKQSDATKRKRERDIALAAVERAEQGLSSVAPFFLLPEKETGRLVLLEGTARRAVRVAAQEGTGEQDYFEIEFFPTDSQNLPIVCCVPQLPQDFPTGDRIRASIRVAGFFFKKWRYQSRKPEDSETARSKAAFAPLIIAPTVSWMQTQSEEAAGKWSVVAGGAVLVVLLLFGFWVLRGERQHRIARPRPRRYDEST